MYHTYILRSTSSGKYYIGQTNNLEDRLKRHNAGENKSTKGRGPWEMIYSKKFETRSEAVMLERKLKAFKNADYLARWVVGSNGEALAKQSYHPNFKKA